MNERDPISDWENAIVKRVGTATVVLILLAFMCCLAAPLFGPSIKHMKRKEYAIFENYEEMAEADMKSIRPLLWIVAVIGWIIMIYCNSHYP
jgi:hypothetical protein